MAALFQLNEVNMSCKRIPWLIVSCCMLAGALFAGPEPACAQGIHDIEGRLRSGAVSLAGVRIKLLNYLDLVPIAETFSRPEGQFRFRQIRNGQYIIETYETDIFEATSTNLTVNPLPPERPSTVTVMIELPLKRSAAPGSSEVVNAEVDANVPKDALKHYRDGKRAQEAGKSDVALSEFQQAVRIHPQYYSARLDLSRELRVQKRYPEAEENCKRLEELMPKRAEPKVEYGILLMTVDRTSEAALKLAEAVNIEEKDWNAHLYLGWVLQDMDVTTSERHFKRALELDESRAAKAHVGLARLAHAKGHTQVALEHLDAYLRIVPNAPDADGVRKLAERLRAKK